MNIQNKKLLMSEFAGIILGDGSISARGYNNSTQNRIKITLNSIVDLDYSYYVVKLIKKLFGIEPLIRKRKNENALDILIFNKQIVNLLRNKIGLQLSPKWEKAIVPKTFLVKPYDLMVLRGYFDTDGSLVVTNNNGTIYPRIEMKICPSPMQNQIIGILKEYEFRFGVYQIGKGEVRIQMNGKKQLRKWIDLVGFSNSKHSLKSQNFFNSNLFE